MAATAALDRADRPAREAFGCASGLPCIDFGFLLIATQATAAAIAAAIAATAALAYSIVVEHNDGSLSFSLRRHLDKRKPFRRTRVAILDYDGCSPKNGKPPDRKRVWRQTTHTTSNLT